MQSEENHTPVMLNEKESARYIGMPCAYLRDRRKNGQPSYGDIGPNHVIVPGSRSIKYRIADLDAWISENPHAVETAEKRHCRARSSKAEFLTQDKAFGELLGDLDTWLVAHRPDFLKGLNGPVTYDHFDRFEQSTGLKLPEDYKLLLGWRDGQVSHWEPPFHPFDHETLMSFADTESTMEMMNELVKTGAIDETHWCRSWLPFTADIFGNHTCMDLSPENYGEILLFDHELDGRIVLFNDLSEWLAELLDKLQYLDVEVWEREGC